MPVLEIFIISLYYVKLNVYLPFYFILFHTIVINYHLSYIYVTHIIFDMVVEKYWSNVL